jgi:NAD(P)H-dependent FMN reductase
MSKILVVSSSVRENRAADNIIEIVTAQLAKHNDFEVTVADFKELEMPFFNSPLNPSSDEYVADNENVIKWGKLVTDADAIVMLVAEYNRSFTSVLKNAIDWLYKEWANVPVVLIGYGWSGGAGATAQLRQVLGSNIAAKPMETEANLRFMKEINVNGTVLDEAATAAAIQTTIEELVTVL